MSFAEQLTRLQAFLDADDCTKKRTMSPPTGYLTALSINAEDVPEREWIDALFAEEKSAKCCCQSWWVRACSTSSRSSPTSPATPTGRHDRKFPKR